MKNYNLVILIILVSTLISGCSVMLPYNDSFDCPQMENGQCVSVVNAYKDAVNANNKDIQLEPAHQEKVELDFKREDLRIELINKYIATENKTQATRTPAIIMELLIMPYQTDFNSLASERTIWLTVQEETWIWTKNTNSNKAEIGASIK